MKSPAMRVVCIGAAVACAQAAQAYVTITYNDHALWANANPFVGGPYYTVYEDDMSTANLASPSYAESSLPQSSQGFWTATPIYTGSLALSGSGAGTYMYAERGVGSTGYQGMLFGLNGPTSLETGLYGVGAYVRLFDSSGNAVAGTVQMAINGLPPSAGFTGQAAVFSVGSSGGFIGFWIDNTNLTTWITSLWIGSTSAAPRVAVDTLYLGVPAPGALALLGAAGLMGSRRRRG